MLTHLSAKKTVAGKVAVYLQRVGGLIFFAEDQIQVDERKSVKESTCSNCVLQI
jgi:hypothetical protein